MSSPRRKIQDIQILRAIACLMVIAQHISLTATLFSDLSDTLSMPFYLGVELFFVISGYVVTLSLFGRELNVVDFLKRRFYRLMPAIVCFLLFSLIVFTFIQTIESPSVQHLNMSGHDQFLRQAAAILFGILINIESNPLYYFSAMWSLSVEYQFYTAYAVFAGLIGLLGLKAASVKSILFFVASLILLVCFISRVGNIHWQAFGVRALDIVDYLLSWRFDFLLFGVCLALIKDRWGALKLPERKTVLLMYFGLFAMPLCVGALSEPPLSAGPKPINERILMPLSALCFTGLVALAAGRHKTVRENAESKIYRLFVWLGNRSYSMYLFHFPVMALIWGGVVVFYPQLFQLGPLWYGGVQCILTLLITIFLSDQNFRRVELHWTK